MKKTIKVKFTDLGYRKEETFIYERLNELYNVEFSEKPDYLIYGVYGTEYLDKKYDNCIKIFNTGEALSPDFNLCDYAIGFDYLIAGDRYFRQPIYFNKKYRNILELSVTKHINPEATLKSKTGFCSFVFTNSNAEPIREQFFKILCNYKKVNSGGKYLNNIGKQLGKHNDMSEKLEFEKKHKFSIAFENGSYEGYTTEKLISAFAAKTVPIYWGDPKVEKIFNPKSMILAKDFSSLENLAKYIEKVDNDDFLYISYLKEPVFLGNEGTFEYEKEKFDAWLRNIFEQPKQNSFRRNCFSFWGKQYVNNLRYLNDFPKNILCKIIRRFFNFFK